MLLVETLRILFEVSINILGILTTKHMVGISIKGWKSLEMEQSMQEPESNQYLSSSIGRISQ